MSEPCVDPFWVARGGRLLSNGRYQVYLDARGGGVSFWQGLQLSAWEPDPVEARHGWWLYLRAPHSGDFCIPTLASDLWTPTTTDPSDLWTPTTSDPWTPTTPPPHGQAAGSDHVGPPPPPPGAPDSWTPTTTPPGADSWTPTATSPGRGKVRGRAKASPGVQVYRSTWQGLEVEVAIWVDAERDVEFRQVQLRNTQSRPRPVEVTSNVEVVLNHSAAHRAHPAFSKLFVQSLWLDRLRALVFRRRPRSAEERWPLLAHAVIEERPTQWESDRAKFLGRGHDALLPRALTVRESLSGTTGSVLDPTAALRQTVELAPGGVERVTFVLAVGETQVALESALEALAGDGTVEKSRAGARRCAQQQQRASQLSPAEALRVEELAVALQYGCGWSSGPRPKATGAREETAEIAPPSSAPLLVWKTRLPLREAVPMAERAVRLWRSRGFPGSIAVAARRAVHWVFSDGIAVRKKALGKLDLPSLDVWETAAHCVVEGDALSLGAAPPRREVRERYRARAHHEPIGLERSALTDWNGWGGFGRQSGAYVMRLEARSLPPMPWVNVIANPRVGCLVSERGAAHTWGMNSREDRLTPWSNDPIVDPFGEAVYLRDERERVFWSPLPGLGAQPCVVSHAPGSSSWRSVCNELEQRVSIFVPPTEPLKVTLVELRNLSCQGRELSLWWYAHLVCGALPEQTRRWIEMQWDGVHRIFFARRTQEKRQPLAFAAVAGGAEVWASGCRLHFLGAGGSPVAPGALVHEARLRPVLGRTGHPAVVMQVALRLPPNGTAEVALLLGEASHAKEARAWVQKFRGDRAVLQARQRAELACRQSASRLQVRTPAPELDRFVNQWLPYQVQSCRLWGRTAFYQSGGAYGFRDQLQDACALLWLDPAATRQQILLHAAHQFPEGDVLHWWHPPWERGTRTRFSDDLLWLPWAVVWYCAFTGDWKLLDEVCPFVQARQLEPGEDEAYLPVRSSRHRADLYTHCALAIDRSLTRGPHGLPLMGTGDWNDGMNRVGRLGRGESVWLGFFLGGLLRHWIPICEARGDRRRATRYREYAGELELALEEHGWDGRWYRRAYYDDGTPLGSAGNQECQIDALVQAWAILSGVAPRPRAEAALEAVAERLIDREAGLIRLLDPPFDRDPHDPGYIKGYVPGVRENGGQYTHAALWVVQAFALLGQRNTAAELLLRLLPQWHSRDAEAVRRYQVEPYVVAADIYSVDPHRGRGGWTWYTGSAGWLYRLTVETILGVRLSEGETLVVRPRIPDSWPECEVEWHPPGWMAPVHIRIENPHGRAERVQRAWVDGTPLPVEGQEVRLGRNNAVAPRSLRVELGGGDRAGS